MEQQPDLQSDSRRHLALQLRAYEFWQQRGEPWGTPEIDWFTAEREIRPEPQNVAPEPAAVTAAKVVGSVLGSVAGVVASLAHAAGASE